MMSRVEVSSSANETSRLSETNWTDLPKSKIETLEPPIIRSTREFLGKLVRQCTNRRQRSCLALVQRQNDPVWT